MINQSANLMRLYLPLLAHSDSEVRRQTALVVQTAYDGKAGAHIRLLSRDDDPVVRRQARAALEALSALGQVHETPVLYDSIGVECLGAFGVHIGGLKLQVQDWGRYDSGRAGAQKLQSVFAYLVHVGGRGATREAIISAVWANSANVSILARTLTSLRKLITDIGSNNLIDALIIDTDRCMLRPDFVHNSADQFERAFTLADQTEQQAGLEAAAPLYSYALHMYGGPYMSDVVRGSGWMLERRELLTGHFVNAAERLAEYAFMQQRYKECVQVCSLALAEEPDADDVTIWLLRAYRELNQHIDLELAYKRYLRAAGITPRSAPVSSDWVMAAYESLRCERKAAQVL